MKFVLIGIQGSGKSTQGNLLSKLFNIPYLSTGHIFREIAKEKTTLGRYIKETINSGALVPDEKAIEIANEYLSRPEYKRGYILDGFPRTLKQVEKFKNHVDKVIYLRIPDKEALWRLTSRKQQRDDETLPAIKKRIEMFHTFTDPVIEYYEKEKRLIDIDGTASIENVNKEILEGLGKQIVENKVVEWKPKKTIIALVGLPGAGKTDASAYFSEKGFPVIHFGKVVNDYINKKGLPHTEEVHKKTRESLRKKMGVEALAILNMDNIKSALKESQVIIIDGMRSWEEYLYLKKHLTNTRIFIVNVYADKKVRYHRAAHRTDRKNQFGEERDINELIGTNMGPTIAFADFVVKNNFSKDDFSDKLETVYRQIYFS
jgi:adenylate kinase